MPSSQRAVDVMIFLKKIMANLSGQLRVDDLKELSRMMDVERNRQLEALKPKKKGKKKKTVHWHCLLGAMCIYGDMTNPTPLLPPSPSLHR